MGHHKQEFCNTLYKSKRCPRLRHALFHTPTNPKFSIVWSPWQLHVLRDLPDQDSFLPPPPPPPPGSTGSLQPSKQRVPIFPGAAPGPRCSLVAGGVLRPENVCDGCPLWSGIRVCVRQSWRTKTWESEYQECIYGARICCCVGARAVWWNFS
jgi:hypothetical protein